MKAYMVLTGVKWRNVGLTLKLSSGSAEKQPISSNLKPQQRWTNEDEYVF